MHMPKVGTIFRWLFAQLALGVAIHFIFVRLPIKLIENAVLGAIDDAIGTAFGITVPGVLNFIWNWIIPFAAAALILWIFHWATKRDLERNAQKGDRFSAIGIVGDPNPALRREKLFTVSIIFVFFVIGTIISGAWLYRVSTSVVIPKQDQISTPSNVKTQPADIPNKIAAIDEARTFLKNNVPPLFLEAKQLNNRVYEFKIGQQLISDIQTCYQHTLALYSQNEEMRQNWRHFDGIPEILTTIPDKEGIPRSKDQLISALSTGQLPIAREHASQWLSFYMKLDQWRIEADDKLVALRRELTR